MCEKELCVAGNIFHGEIKFYEDGTYEVLEKNKESRELVKVKPNKELINNILDIPRTKIFDR